MALRRATKRAASSNVVRSAPGSPVGPPILRPASLALGAINAKRAEARDLLAPLYGWFTEGLDTPILQDAQVLLDELRRLRALVRRSTLLPFGT
jgi:hypothetical protein